MDAVSSSLAARQEFAFNGLKQAAQQDQSAVALSQQAVADSKAAQSGGSVTPTRGSHINIVV